MMKHLSYFDCAATTPVDPEVFLAMQPYFSQDFGNPGSLHGMGQKTQAAIDISRQNLAQYFGIEFANLVFTASATEANNLVIKGVAMRAREFGFEKPHVIVSSIEHRSVLKPAEDFASSGLIDLDYLKVDKSGCVEVSSLKKLLRKQTVLVSVMRVNNETGAVQPIKDLAKIIGGFRQEKIAPKNQAHFSVFELPYPLLHTDAAQGWLHLDREELTVGADLVSVSGHKIYGPKGIGILASLNLPFSRIIFPLIVGGSQELDFRAGTENVPAIVGLARALARGEESFSSDQKRIKEFRNLIVKAVFTSFPKAVLNTPEASIAEILNFSFPGYTSEDLVYLFDKEGVAVSGGSACEAKALQPSHVLLAMGLSRKLAGASVRFSLGRLTEKKELSHLLRTFAKIFSRD